MKTILDYTLFCTEAQTTKALELGAPIIELPFTTTMPQMTCEKYGFFYNRKKCYQIPTAEQMLGWMEDQGITSIEITFSKEIKWKFEIFGDDYDFNAPYNSRKEATLAAIDAALEYLTNKKK